MRGTIVFFVALLIALPSMAQQSMPLVPLQPYNSIAYYEVAWSGITVGGMAIAAHDDDKAYSMEVQVKSNGLAWVFTKHKSTTTVEGIKRGGRYIPQQFETWFTLRDDTRHIVLDYDKKGHLTNELNTPPEDRSKRPEVPADLKRGIIDPLTLFFTQRQEIYKALQNGHDRFTIRMYDGRRLTDMHYFVQGRKEVHWNNQDRRVIVFNLSRSPVAGFKPGELEEIEDKKDPAVSLYLSDDGLLIPLKIVIDSSAGTFYANLKHNCNDMDSCAKTLQ
jgi:hypothetical protein